MTRSAFRGHRRQHDDRNVMRVAQAPAKLEPVRARQHDVEQHEVDLGIPERAMSCGPSRSKRCAETAARAEDATRPVRIC